MVGADGDESARRPHACQGRSGPFRMVYEFSELPGAYGQLLRAKAAGKNPMPSRPAAQDTMRAWPIRRRANTRRWGPSRGAGEKIDKLTGFWAIDEKPTGSKTLALRRAPWVLFGFWLENDLSVDGKAASPMV